MANLKKRTVILMIIIPIVLISIGLGVFLNHTSNKSPILKVMVETGNTWIFPGTKYYYNVYENGKYEKIDKFSFSEVKSYDLYDIEDKINNDSESVDPPPYAMKITELVKKMGDSFFTTKLFVINDRVFFNAYDGEKYTESLFEYFPNDNQSKKIVLFGDVDIKHVELYKPQ